MRSRSWLLVIAAVALGISFHLPAASANPLVRAFCGAQKLPGNCLITPGARCNKLDCYLENGGSNRAEAKEEYDLLKCEMLPQCEYTGPKMSKLLGVPVGPFIVKNCLPNYTGVCLTAGGGDWDCKRGPDEIPEADGPNYIKGTFGRNKKLSDPYNLDTDNDGIACEYQPR